MIQAAIRMMTPYLLAATGGLFSERAGVLNIALEGLMLIGAFASVVVTAATHSLTLGIAAGMAASGIVALFYGVVALRLQANIFVAGIATNLLASGLTVVLAERFFGHKGVVRFPDFPDLPSLVPPHWLGGLGTALLGHTVLVPVAWLLVLAAWVGLNRTPVGLRLRATGVDPRVASTLGLQAFRYQAGAIALSGLFCGIAGASLALSLRAFVPNVTAGRGWIALVIIYLGGRRLAGIVAASLLFGLAESVSNYAQGFLRLPADLILAFPYILSLLALVIDSILAHRRRLIARRREREEI
jgi:ABC-type uncharacterized transport system permease subunit